MHISTDIREKLEEKAVKIIKNAVTEMDEEDIVIGIPGGRSVSGIFHRLKSEKLPWDRIHFFMVDERLVPPDDKDSNFYQARIDFIDELIGTGVLPKANVHGFIYDKESEDGGITAYEKEFFDIADRFDIIILSSGEDGHVASLFPDHESIKDEHNGFILVKDAPKEPKNRMSASKLLLSDADVSILLFFGKDKDPAFDRYNDDSILFDNCPAKLVNSSPEGYILKEKIISDLLPESEEEELME